MQTHCIEVAKNSIDVLNPGQVTVDTSGQLVYAPSRQLQQMFPDSLGPRNYLSMFGGLHIEKLLLEIHGQFIARSGLAKFLYQAKVSIAGVGNIVTNVSQITSAQYLLQVYLCAEYKARRVVFHYSEFTDDIQDWMGEKHPNLPCSITGK